jgi:hypothetical protein
MAGLGCAFDRDADGEFSVGLEGRAFDGAVARVGVARRRGAGDPVSPGLASVRAAPHVIW